MSYDRAIGQLTNGPSRPTLYKITMPSRFIGRDTNDYLEYFCNAAQIPDTSTAVAAITLRAGDGKLSRTLSDELTKFVPFYALHWRRNDRALSCNSPNATASFLAQQLSRRGLIRALAMAVRARFLAAQTRAARAVHPAQLASRPPRGGRNDFGDADSAAGGRFFPHPVPVGSRPAPGGASRRRLAARGHRARSGASSHGDSARAGHSLCGCRRANSRA